MKKIMMISLFFPLLYVGCGEVVVKQKKRELNVTTNKKQKEILSQLGLDIQNQKISIDINKTTNFFKKMEIEMHGKADEIQHKMEKADINFTRDMGFNFSDEKLEIDFNKTRKMFQEINLLMKEVLLDKNSSKY